MRIHVSTFALSVLVAVAAVCSTAHGASLRGRPAAGQAQGAEIITLFTRCFDGDEDALASLGAKAAKKFYVSSPFSAAKCSAVLAAAEKVADEVYYVQELTGTVGVETTPGGAVWKACGGDNDDALLDDVVKCWHDKQVSASSSAKLGGLCFSDEGEALLKVGSTDVSVASAVVGAFARLYPDEALIQVARGPASYCAFGPQTTLKEVATFAPESKCPPGAKTYPATQWLPENSFEPYGLNGDPASPSHCAKRLPASKEWPNTMEKCCDGSTVTKLAQGFPELFGDASGFAKLANTVIPAESSTESAFVTIGMTGSNANCQAKDVATLEASVQALLGLGRTKIALYQAP